MSCLVLGGLAAAWRGCTTAAERCISAHTLGESGCHPLVEWLRSPKAALPPASCTPLSILTMLSCYALACCRGISNTAGTLSGVVGVAVTGYLLQWAGGASHPAGWYQACAAAALQCMAASFIFISAARGERLFGSDASATEQAAWDR